MDATTTVQALRDKARAFRDARNWAQFHDPKNLAAALSIEAAELQEVFLWKNKDEVAALVASEAGRAKLREEAADVFLFLLHFAESTGLDLSSAVEDKLRVNERKYPVEKSYNSHRKYDELGQK
ncbi:MAG: nucleotide pyrophosphohydrolase [Planctomycetes bacterium]|nr:nucleotide pyrophosphohydrolase [Planctomycetota bacterium]